MPVEKWEGAYNATQDGASCPQPNVEPVSEDCLFLNVYTTKVCFCYEYEVHEENCLHDYTEDKNFKTKH